MRCFIIFYYGKRHKEDSRAFSGLGADKLVMDRISRKTVPLERTSVTCRLGDLDGRGKPVEPVGEEMSVGRIQSKDNLERGQHIRFGKI